MAAIQGVQEEGLQSRSATASLLTQKASWHEKPVIYGGKKKFIVVLV